VTSSPTSSAALQEEPLFPKKYFPIFTVGRRKQARRKKKKNTGLSAW